ncbi:hypothetical protein CE557_372 [Cardinium endosymbiont of Sogatella furcifera]|uniref:DUF6048 family protein n=1 Tax=Cardinium endosymbiont of Sogatella furcifera TaxID=650378 RepID=UPI000E0CD7DE|nr:DUF6048 family protein [Cardinium endosymbiont of Sogatella furcifera]AXI24196.1 hypothetical protein CE557_372 [Cardinium endosymbiont of Sogatella furcifera]
MLRYIIKSIGYMVLSVVLPQCVVANVQLSNHRIWPTTWYLGIDVAKTCVGWYQKTGPAYEIHSSIDFYPILLDVDYGLGQIQRDGRPHNGSFASARGQYFRVGLGYNFLTPTAHHNQFFIGLRYARSFFDFQLKSNKLQCNHPSNKACSPQRCIAPIALRHSKDAAIVHWWEVVAGGKVYLMRALSIGCTVRYKFSKKIENKLCALPFDIPGFGLAEFDHAFGYSLYVLLRIPLQQNKQPSGGNVAQKSVS